MPSSRENNASSIRQELKFLDWLLLALPASLAIRFVPAWKNDVALFFITAIALIPLAVWMGRATEQLSRRVGAGVGGLLNATFGNAPELIISLMALSKGLVDVVKASIIGSIIGNILLILGIAVLAGGIRFKHLRFNQTGARSAATSLTLAVIGLIVPSVFQFATGRQASASIAMPKLSLAIAVVLFVTYALWLLFSLVTHKQLFDGENSEEVSPEEKRPWPAWKAVVVLAVSTMLVAVMSDILADSVETACKSLGLTEVFVGIIVVGIIGNAGESPAIAAALKNKMELSLGIAIGSSLQIALFVMPALVFASYLFGRPMTLELSFPEVAALFLAVGIVVLISGDGECNWVEGAQLLAVYLILAILFFFLPDKRGNKGAAGSTAPSAYRERGRTVRAIEFPHPRGELSYL